MHKQNTDQIIPFSFRGNNIRAIMLQGEPWFVAKDVCEVLGIGNPSDVVRGLDEDEKMTLDNIEGHSGQRGGAQFLNVVSESGLYALIFKSRKPEAKTFRKWVTSEVLPTLRKTGRYTMPELDPEEAYNRVGANRADIFHHRGPTSKSGLDIRYTMDLTKIALNPNPRTLDLVQRLTGVDMSDLVEEMDSRLASARNWDLVFCDFVQDCLTVMPGSRLRCTKLYAVFKRWYARVQEPGADEFRARIPSMRTLNTALRKRGYRIEKAGVYYVLDVAIPGSCPYRWDDSDEIEQRDPSTLRPSFAR